MVKEFFVVIALDPIDKSRKAAGLLIDVRDICGIITCVVTTRQGICWFLRNPLTFDNPHRRLHRFVLS